MRSVAGWKGVHEKGYFLGKAAHPDLQTLEDSSHKRQRHMTPALRPVILIGPMGSGKSTVGKHLAKRMNRQFVDSDRELEKRSGAAIPWIFDIEGEEGFRKRETAVLETLVRLPDTVIATGGGAVLSEHNRRLLSSAGPVVYLTADPDVLFERVAKDKGRPLLQVENPRATYLSIVRDREPIYRDMADICFVSSANQVPAAAAKKIHTELLEI